jgi:hypothetical protein
MATAVFGRPSAQLPFNLESASKPEAYGGSDVVPVEQATTVSYQTMSDRQVAATEDCPGKGGNVEGPTFLCG